MKSLLVHELHISAYVLVLGYTLSLLELELNYIKVLDLLNGHVFKSFFLRRYAQSVSTSWSQ